jgi:hypothetical protein
MTPAASSEQDGTAAVIVSTGFLGAAAFYVSAAAVLDGTARFGCIVEFGAAAMFGGIYILFAAAAVFLCLDVLFSIIGSGPTRGSDNILD